MHRVVAVSLLDVLQHLESGVVVFVGVPFCFRFDPSVRGVVAGPMIGRGGGSGDGCRGGEVGHGVMVRKEDGKGWQ